jgi:hypothetical protein
MDVFWALVLLLTAGDAEADDDGDRVKQPIGG